MKNNRSSPSSATDVPSKGRSRSWGMIHNKRSNADPAPTLSGTPPSSLALPLPPPAALSALPEDDVVINATPPSPGTPKKLWEKSYRSFLKSKDGSTEIACNVEAESSIRGGKMFANVFPPVRQRKSKSLSADELDGTLRRGAEKAYSPGNSRYKPVVSVSTSLPEFLPPSGYTRTKSALAATDVRPNVSKYAVQSPLMTSTAAGMTMATMQSLSPTQQNIADPTQQDSSNSLMERGKHFSSRSSGHDQVEDMDSSSSAIKKAFTEFHNSQETGRDAVSAFLGDDPSHRGHHELQLAWASQSQNQAHLTKSMSHGSVLHEGNAKLCTVHENVAIRTTRMLKPVQSVEDWQPGRRYLIAPPAWKACPVTVITTLTTSTTLDAKQALESEYYPYGTVVLGNCLLSYSKGGLDQQWSDSLLVLRQNYLLEYNPGANVRGLPRGYAHLQYANCYIHQDFSDALELHFYASPCAKSDKRMLIIRLHQRDERHSWMKLLNKAARLQISDLYEYDNSNALGTGSYAHVFKACRAVGPNEGCALKIFEKNKFWRMVVKGRERADTLVREVSVQATLTARCGRVQSFLQLRGLFETADHVVLELELLEGNDLFKYISSNGVICENEAAAILSDVVQALEAMNRIGLAHRDIKPSNILMCKSSTMGPRVKVADFGMATFVGVDGQVRGRCGTPGYVAPEVFTAGIHEGYGNKVDVFSAGVTLYVMLCGYEPFYGETDAELVQANRRAEIEFPKEEWASISESAKDLLRRMLHADPSSRLTAKDVLHHPWLLNCYQTSLDSSISLPQAALPSYDACTIN